MGGVLIDWNPRHLHRELIVDEADMERFLAEVCTSAWNLRKDAGRPTAEATLELVARHPDKRELIEAFYSCFDAMTKDAIHGTVAILEELDARGTPLYLLSNASGETFPQVESRFAFLRRFHSKVISGREKMIKPDPEIFHSLCRRFGLDPRACVFIDDHEPNVASARALGFHGHHFREPDRLRRDLVALGLLAV